MATTVYSGHRLKLRAQDNWVNLIPFEQLPSLHNELPRLGAKVVGYLPIFETVARLIREVVTHTRKFDWPLTFLQVQHAQETTDELRLIATDYCRLLLNSISETDLLQDIEFY